MIVENAIAAEADIAVHVTGEDGETLFSRVFALGSEQIVSRDGTAETPARVHAFTADGVSHGWEYDPDLAIELDCEPKDVGLTLRDEAIEPWYDC